MSKHSTPEAVLFDFNGVLVNDEHWHWRAFREVLRPLGIRLTRAEYDARYLAFDDVTACRAMLRDAGLPPRRRTRKEAERLVRAKRRWFRAACARHGVGVAPVTARLVRRLARSLPLAIVSGAVRVEILSALRRAGLVTCFRTIVSAEDVRRCKPDPEGYRKALRRLGVSGAARCVAVEDSPGGIAAARAAGLRVVGVATSYRPEHLRRAGAAGVVSSLVRTRAAELFIMGKLGKLGMR